MYARSRLRVHVDVRSITSLLITKHLPKTTYKEIAILFGRKDHTFVLYSVKRARRLISKGDKEFLIKYNLCNERLNEYIEYEKAN